MNTRASTLLDWIPLALASLVGIAGLVALAAHAYMGQFSRYIADDFCTAGTLVAQGFWTSQQYWYMNWSGRYSFTFFMSLSQLVGPKLTPILPAIALSAWLGASVVLMHVMLSEDDRRAGWLVPSGLAALLVFGVVEGAPNIYQSLYWQTGMITYAAPLVLWAVYLSWLLSRHRRPGGREAAWREGLLAAGSAFILGGFSETFASLQAAALAIGLGILVLGRKREGLRRLTVPMAAGFFGALAAMGAIIAAPGNAIRAGALPIRQSLLAALIRSLQDGYIFSARAARNQTLMIVLLMAVPMVLAWAISSLGRVGGSRPRVGPRDEIGKVILIPAATGLLILATIVPYEYGIGSYPDGRVLITSTWVLDLGLMLWGMALGRLASVLFPAGAFSSAAMLMLVVLLAALAGRQSWLAIVQTLGQRQQAMAYATAWDKRDEALRAASLQAESTVEAASLRHMAGLAELENDPSVWINRCIAQAYGVRQVVAK
jgi:hypothetical protein